MTTSAIDARRAPPRRGVGWSALLWIFRRIIGVYFRSIEARGETPSASTGGRVFVANHVNALVDPILVLTSAPCSVAPVAKSTLWKIPGLRWLLDAAQAVPIQRRRDDPAKAMGSNDAVFDEVAASLSGGRNILIFPEGVSHNEPRLLDVKTGAARMLARAHALGARGLTFQAVGLEFDDRTVFRSRCLLLYGPVRELDAFGLEGDALVAAVAARMRDDLTELLIEAPTWDERRAITRVAELLANDAGDASLEGLSRIGRQVGAARAMLGASNEDAAAIARAVDRYHALLEREGVGDRQLASGEVPEGGVLRAVALALALPLAAVGIALYAIPHPWPGLVAHRLTKEPDMLSTYKLGVGLLVHTLWAAALVVIAFVALPPRPALVALVVVLASPFAALAWLDRTPELKQSLRFQARAHRLAELTRARAELMAQIEAVRAKLGA